MMYFLKTAAAASKPNKYFKWQDLLIYHRDKMYFRFFCLAEDENDYSKDMRHKDEDETDDSQSAMVWVILAILGGGFLFFLYNTWRCHQKK